MTFAYVGDQLCCDEHPIRELVEGRATPFFLFSARRMHANYDTLREAFEADCPGTRINYCLKTNYEYDLLRLIHGFGAGVMVTCGWEIELALAAGFRSEQIAFHGPCKSLADLELALSERVGVIHLYSPEELDQLEGLVAVHGCSADASIRVAAPESWMGQRLHGWYAGRLGVSREVAERLVQRMAGSARLRPRGLSFHVGTQVLRADAYLRGVGHLMPLAAKLEAQGIALHEISLGGGWPSDTLVPMGAGAALRALLGRETERVAERLAPLARSVAAGYRLAAQRHGLPNPPEVVLEPGRGIVGSAGALVTRVVRTQGRWTFVDGSHNFLPESWLVGRRAILPTTRTAGPRPWSHLSGRTLNTADVMALGVRLPRPGPGDVLVLLDAGAYSLSRANRYAGTIPAAYLMDEQGDFRLIRAEDGYSDIVAGMAPLAAPRLERE